MSLEKSAEQKRREQVLAIIRGSKNLMLRGEFEKSQQSNSRLTSTKNTTPQEKGWGRKTSEIELLGQYPLTLKTGRKITITKLSRSFVNDEELEDHRNYNCGFIDECTHYAGKLKIDCFSCINCDQKNDRSAI